MTERNLLLNPPGKVLLMYEAVAGMLKEGADIGSMKVSDITAQAGIGKGTAYEYFSSKESLIIMALIYDVQKKRAALEESLEQRGTFREKVTCLLDYVEEHFGETQTFCALVKIGTGAYEIPEALKREYIRTQSGKYCGQMEGLIDRILAQGRREGVIKQENAYLGRIALGAQIIAFASHIIRQDEERQSGEIPSRDTVKEFVYEAVVKSLN